MKPTTKPKNARPGRPRDEDLPARRRSEIIHHAINEFARSGYSGADLEVIAKNAGCSKGTLYNYFTSKDELFNASVDHVMFSMVRTVDDSDVENADPVWQLRDLIRGFLKHFATHPEFVELLVQERSDFRDRRKPTYYAYREASRLKWQRRFKTMIDAGRMRKMATGDAIDTVANLLYGTIFLNHFRGRKADPDRQAKQLLDVLLGGLLTEQEFARR